MDIVEGLVDLLSNLGARQDDFSGNEDKKDDFRLDHSINETCNDQKNTHGLNFTTGWSYKNYRQYKFEHGHSIDTD